MSSAEIAAFAARLKTVGVNLPVDILDRASKAAAASAGIDAARRGSALSVRVSKTAKGSTVVLTGKGAKTAAAVVRADLARRLPDVRRQVAAEIRKRMGR
jgi:hypothetical protein